MKKITYLVLVVVAASMLYGCGMHHGLGWGGHGWYGPGHHYGYWGDYYGDEWYYE